MQSYKSEYFKQFLADAQERRRSKTSKIIEWTAIILLSGWLGVALFVGMSGGF